MSQVDCPEEDWKRWKREKRQDILSRIDVMKIAGHVVARDMWMNPDGELALRCPWLFRRGAVHYCRIHSTKPSMCRDFVPSPDLAQRIGCQGWDDDGEG